MENGLGLTTITGLLSVVTTLTLGEKGSLECMCERENPRSKNSPMPYLASLVLGNLVLGVLAASLALAEGLASLGNVDLRRFASATRSSRQLNIQRPARMTPVPPYSSSCSISAAFIIPDVQ